MFKHILAPLDGSSLAECVLPHIRAITNAFDSQLTLLRVLEQPQPDRGPQVIDLLDWHIHENEAMSYLKQISSDIQVDDIHVQPILLEGRAAEQIIDYTHSQDVDLIILSTHGASGLTGWNVSSVVQKVVLRAHTSMLLVRAYQPAENEPFGHLYHKILVALDGSRRAEMAIPAAVQLAKSCDAELLLAHVIRRPDLPYHTSLSIEDSQQIDHIVERAIEQANHCFRQIRSQSELQGIALQTHLLHNQSPTVALHEIIQREKIDLVLLTAHGCSANNLWPYGTVATNFIAYGTTALMIIQDLTRDDLGQTLAETVTKQRKGH